MTQGGGGASVRCEDHEVRQAHRLYILRTCWLDSMYLDVTVDEALGTARDIIATFVPR